jgi:penicillin G amidase
MTRAEIYRDAAGVPHIEAASLPDLLWGMGYVHALDRGLQLLMMRILGQGRVSEILAANDESLAIDTFFRRLNWAGNMGDALTGLEAPHRAAFDAYCEGVNAGFQKRTPWEFRLFGYRPEPWKLEDSVLLSRMAGYLTLSQSQGEVERLFVELVQAGIERDKLEELFPGLIGDADLDLLRRVSLGERLVPREVLWNTALPNFMASNSWVVSGAKTASGMPILANDPHLEVNRLPNVWSEMVLKTPERYAIGATMPGLPAMLLARTPDLAWGATYTFMDSIDSWIERCAGGKYLKDEARGEWESFTERREVILRRRKPPVEIVFYENEHGVLDGDPRQDGDYLATRWASDRSGAVSLTQTLRMWDAPDVPSGMDALGRLESSFNWVLADRHGNIGYQMSGLFPIRREGASGFVPLPGWMPENNWKGFAAPESLPRCLNPEEGFFVTANDDLNRYGGVKPINMPMGDYRAERLRQLLREGASFTTPDFGRMQYDVFSREAEEFMRIVEPLLPPTPKARVLKEWDFTYAPDSQGAYLFERFQRALYMEVFGRGGLGGEVMDFLRDETGLFIDFFANFNRVLLSEESAWFGGESREAIFQRALERALEGPTYTWGEKQRVMMSHMLFGGKLPAVLGFDRGPITIRGGRATPHQGQIYRSAGRVTTFVASYRLLTDFAEDACHTNLAGGPSDRRFSEWYVNDLERWLNGDFKTVRPDETGSRRPFP